MLREPSPLKGVAERKGAFRLGGGAWKEVYVEVRAPGYLYIFKDKKQADNTMPLPPSASPPASTPDLQIVDLRVVLEFGGGGSEKGEVELDLGGDRVRLRFGGAEEGELWRKGLIDWKDYCVDYSKTSIHTSLLKCFYPCYSLLSL